MTLWPFWAGGLFLAAVPIAHWFLLHRMFAVSGRFTAVTDWLRGRRATTQPLDSFAMLIALRMETEAEFGPSASLGPEPVAAGSHGAIASAPTGITPHLVFLIAVAIGGTLSAWLATGRPPSVHGPDALFHHFFGTSTVGNTAVLFAGGLLVGFGTRMAGGCTSGHGLCGVSRLQPGSLLSTACFFGGGIVVSFVLRALLGGG